MEPLREIKPALLRWRMGRLRIYLYWTWKVSARGIDDAAQDELAVGRGGDVYGSGHEGDSCVLSGPSGSRTSRQTAIRQAHRIFEAGRACPAGRMPSVWLHATHIACSWRPVSRNNRAIELPAK